MARICIIFTISLLGFASCIEPGGNSRAELRRRAAKLAEKCRATEGVSIEQMTGITNLFGNISGKSGEVNCVSSCIIKELKLVDSDDMLVMPKFVKYVRQYFDGNHKRFEKGLKLVEACSDVKFLEDCGVAEEFRICINEARASQRRQRHYKQQYK